jgi:hypothetical protein
MYANVVERIKERDPEGAYKGAKSLTQKYAEFLSGEKEKSAISKTAVA